MNHTFGRDLTKAYDEIQREKKNGIRPVTKTKLKKLARGSFVCPHCGAKWQVPPKRDRRKYDQTKKNMRRFGRANRRRTLAYKCCQAQPGVMR